MKWLKRYFMFVNRGGLTRGPRDGARRRNGEEQRDQRVHPALIRSQYACFLFTARTENAPRPPPPPPSSGAATRADRYPAHILIDSFGKEGSISTLVNLTAH